MQPMVLYVEDKIERLQTMRALLESKGYIVLTAENGQEALELFKHNPVQLSIVDYAMPAMNGDVVARGMKFLKPHVPVIIFSGVLSLSDRVIAMVDGFISTAEEPDVLLNKISELLPLNRAKAS